MKRRFFGVLSAFVLGLSLIAANAYSQTTEVKEHKTEVDSATGKITTTTAVIEKTEEETYPYTDMININPLKFFVAYNLNWVHKLSSNLAFGLGAEVTTTHGDYGYEQTGWGVLGEVRFYPSKKSMHGFYIAPNFSLTRMSNVYYYSELEDFGSGVYSATTLSLGLLIGWQWYPATDFSIGLGLGVDDYIPLNSRNGSLSDFNLLGGIYGRGSSPTVRFDLGYVW